MENKRTMKIMIDDKYGNKAHAEFARSPHSSIVHFGQIMDPAHSTPATAVS